jgi:hypothetical protein
MSFDYFWTPSIIAHLDEHGVSQADFEGVVEGPVRRGFSKSTGLPAAWGFTPDGRYIICVYDWIDAVTILPVTAYEV